MFKNPFFKVRCGGLLIAILAAVFILPTANIYAQSVSGDPLIDTVKLGEDVYDAFNPEDVYDALNPFPAGPTACGVSGECRAIEKGCDSIYEISSVSNNCSKKEQCCTPTKCIANSDGIGTCRQSEASCRADEPISKNTSDCLPPKSCCIYPKIPELTCPGGVCSEDTLISDIPMSPEEGEAACAQDENSSDCQQYRDQQGAAACLQDPNSSDCQQYLSNEKEKGLVPCEGFNCTLCSVFELGKNIIDWLVGFIFAISVGFIVWAGMLMMFSGGDTSKVSKARETATTAVIGVALALGGWLIVGTLLGVLTGSDKVMPWNKIECSSKPIGIGTGAEIAKQSAKCTAAGGICKNKSTALCIGTYTDLCGTDNKSKDIQCCVSSSGNSTNYTCVSPNSCLTMSEATQASSKSPNIKYTQVSGTCSSGKNCWSQTPISSNKPANTCPYECFVSPTAAAQAIQASGKNANVSCNTNYGTCQNGTICCWIQYGAEKKPLD